jgi:hypothetical protein
MGRKLDGITPELAEWLGRQQMFLVATAPLAADGLVNCSPKGMDCFRVLGPLEVAYLDLTGSGVETIAHLRENGRITLMFCEFAGAPKIVRLHGKGTILVPGTSEFDELKARFPDHPGARAIIKVALTRVGESCGFAVPRYEHVGKRDALLRWAESKGPEALARYRNEKNSRSLDGLPGLDAEV